MRTQQRAAAGGGRPLPPGRRRLSTKGRYRMVAMLAVMGLAFGAVAGKLVYIQGLSADRYLAFGRSERIRTIDLPGERGSIFDRNGRELALSIEQTTFWANPHLVTDPLREAEALAPILGQTVEDLQTKLSRAAGFVYLARKVDDSTAARVNGLKLDGVFSLQEPKRFLPDGQLAAPLLGVVGTDNTGLSGLEHEFDRVLSGRPGRLIQESDPRGSEIPGGLHQYQPPARGDDLVLTIDQSLQYETEQALAAEIVAADAKGGMAMIMDSKTGEILAAANLVHSPTPTGGPGHPGSSTPQVVPAPSAGTFTQVFEPGSVNKLITISAALQAGMIKPSDKFKVPFSMQVGPSVFRDAEFHAPQDWSVTDILANSSNIGTIAIAQKLGKDTIDQYLRSFGFGTTTGVNFPGESAGLLLAPSKWSATSIATVPIGQGVAVTATQMLAAYNTIANGGIYVAPKLIKATIDTRGRQHPTAPSPQHRVVSPKVADQMTAMLDEVVRVGTGKAAAIADGYTVAGKTGTAYKPLTGARGYMNGVYVSSFAGFVPAERPALTGIVILDETPLFGGASAAPLFASIVRYGLREFLIPPQPANPPTADVPLATGATAQAVGEPGAFPPATPGPPPATPSVPRRAQGTTTTTKPPGHSTATTVPGKGPPGTAPPPTTSTTRPAIR
jgi:cell division protein FtsI (penicillin-binding protein 3)